MQIRKSNERGHFKLEWLESYHSFSFGDYHDSQYVNFGPLRVLNQDWIKASSGFPLHSHRDMEIITYIIDGELEHRDTLGTQSTIRVGEIQRMSAGSGIKHSESNPSSQNTTQLLQIWINPLIPNLAPSYEQKKIPNFENLNGLCKIAAPTSDSNRGAALTLNQDASIILGKFKQPHTETLQIPPHRKIWIQNIAAPIHLSFCGPTATTPSTDITLSDGDGVSVNESGLSRELCISAETHSHFLIFDLPRH